MKDIQNEEKLLAIKKEQIKIPIYLQKLQGNQGMAIRDNKKSLAFKVVGYDGHGQV